VFFLNLLREEKEEENVAQRHLTGSEDDDVV